MVVRATFHRTDQPSDQVSSEPTFAFKHGHYVIWPRITAVNLALVRAVKPIIAEYVQGYS